MNYNKKFLTAFDKNSLYPSVEPMRYTAYNGKSLLPLLLKMRNERPLTREEIDTQICEVLNNEHN